MKIILFYSMLRTQLLLYSRDSNTSLFLLRPFPTQSLARLSLVSSLGLVVRLSGSSKKRIQDGSRKSGRSILLSALSSRIQWYSYTSSSPPFEHSPVSRTYLMPFYRIFEILRIDHQYPDVNNYFPTIKELDSEHAL
jgi:hypothetical protein